MVVDVMPYQQIRDVLHAIAISPDTETCVNLILNTALQITGAAGAAFYSFNEPIIAMALGEAPDLGVHLFVTRSDDFVLLGYTLDQTSVTPGDLFSITLFWRPLKEIDAYYRPVVQLVNLPLTAAWGASLVAIP